MIQLKGRSYAIIKLTSHEVGKANKSVWLKRSRVQVGKNLSNVFSIRNVLKLGDALSPLLFNPASEYAISRFQVN